MRQTVLLRTDGANATGMGHFFRCLALCGHMKPLGFEPVFALRIASEQALDLLRDKGIRFHLIPEDFGWAQEAEHLARTFPDRDVIYLADFAHYRHMQDLEGLGAYSDHIASHFRTSAMIDGYFDTSMAARADLGFDMVFMPYEGELDTPLRTPPRFVHHTGARFFTCQPEYLDVERKTATPDKAETLLITMGGSDPYELTALAMRAVAAMERQPRCRVVVGPSFSPSLTEEIKTLASALDQCELITAPPTLAQLITEADMGFSAAGLTKYEFALCGTPSIQISFNPDIALINEKYARCGACLDLGLYTDLGESDIADAIRTLMEDKTLRQRIIDAGRAIVDTRGAERILALLGEHHCPKD